MGNISSRRKKLLTLTGILLVIAIGIGISFSFWNFRETQELSNVITTDCLSITLSDESDAFELESTYPISDEEGK